MSLSGELTVADVRPEDSGYYICQAISVAGSVLTKALLEVESGESLGLVRLLVLALALCMEVVVVLVLVMLLVLALAICLVVVVALVLFMLLALALALCMDVVVALVLVLLLTFAVLVLQPYKQLTNIHTQVPTPTAVSTMQGDSQLLRSS